MRTHLQRATAIMVASGGIILALAGCQLIILSGSNIDQQAEALADEFDQTKFVLVDAQDYRNVTEPEPTQYAVNLRTIVFNTLYPSYIAGYLAAGTTSTGTVGVNADETFNERWQRMGILAVEMESAGLYATAAHAEVEALGMFTVLASLVPGEATTEKERETAFTPMMELALPWRRSEEGTTMKKTEVAQMIDHTLLKPEATAADVAALVAQGAELGTYSVCVSPSMLPLETPEGLMVACVAGFPSGAVKPEIKAAEATRAVEDGADEVDMVINIALVKEGREAELEAEIRAVRDAVPAPRVLKVIIESAALTDEEIVMACRASENAGADFVKTSTGFHPAGGASVHAVKLMRETVGDRLGVKASGGIRDATTALAMIEAGASRLGVSATVAILEGIEE